MRILTFIIVLLFGSQSFAGTKRWIPKITTGRTFFVDTNGSDAANGLTTGTAWKTVSKVNAQTFLPGDTIQFKCDGKWLNDPLIVPSSGSAGSYIKFTSYSTGARPVFDGANSVSGIQVASKNFVYLSDLEATNASGGGYDFAVTSASCIISNAFARGNKGGAGNGVGFRNSASGTIVDSFLFSNEDNGASPHDTASVTNINNICTNNANCGFYSVSTLPSYLYTCTLSSNVNAGAESDNGPIILTNCFLGTNLGKAVFLAGGWALMTNCVVTNNLAHGVYHNSAGQTSVVSQCTFGTNAIESVLITQGGGQIYSNVFSGVADCGIFVQNTADADVFWNRSFDVGLVRSSTTGNIDISFNLCDGDASGNDHTGIYLTGTPTASSVVQNNYVNSSGQVCIRNDGHAANIANNAARNATFTFYDGATGHYTNNIGDNNDLPSGNTAAGNGNIRSATFTAQFSSLVPGNANYAIPLISGQAYQGGVANKSKCTTYFNGVAVSGTLNIGAMGGGQ